MSTGGIGILQEIPSEINGVPVVEQGENSQLGREDFLKLLTVQLGNQDPLNPISNEDFIAQQATFAALEQQLNLNENFEKFLEAQQETFNGLNGTFSTIQSASYLGNEVEFPSDQLTITGGNVDQLFFNVFQPVNVAYEVRNEAGNVVREVEPASYDAGEGYSIDFDGKDNFGQTLPDGNYSVNFDIKDPDGAPLTGSAYARRTVSAVDFRLGVPVLRLENGESISLEDVLSINKEVTS